EAACSICSSCQFSAAMVTLLGTGVDANFPGPLRGTATCLTIVRSYFQGSPCPQTSLSATRQHVFSSRNLSQFPSKSVHLHGTSWRLPPKEPGPSPTHSQSKLTFRQLITPTVQI